MKKTLMEPTAKRFILEGVEALQEYQIRMQERITKGIEKSTRHRLSEYHALTICFRRLLQWPPRSPDARRYVQLAYDHMTYAIEAYMADERGRALHNINDALGYMVHAAATYKGTKHD